MAEEHAEGRVAVLTPLYERLLMQAFMSLGALAPTVLTICRPREKPLFEAPEQWPVQHEPTWETLPARATELRLWVRPVDAALGADLIGEALGG
ncbi:hypothetical protein ACWCQW_48140 [Streptomyces mirabilis]